MKYMIKEFFEVFLRKKEKFPIVMEDFFSSNIEESIIDDLVDETVNYANARFKSLIGKNFDQFCEELSDETKDEKNSKLKRNGFATWDYCVKESNQHVIKYALEKYNIQERILFDKFPTYYNLEQVVDLLGLQTLERYDAYGSGLYMIDGIKYVLMSTDKNGSDRAGVVISLCMYDNDTKTFELADILYDAKFYLSEIQTAKTPEYLNKFNITDFCCKRGWNWKVKEKELHLKTHSDFSFLDKEHKTADGNRILIKLE